MTDEPQYLGTQATANGQIQFEIWNLKVPLGWATITVGPGQDRQQVFTETRLKFSEVPRGTTQENHAATVQPAG